MKIIEWPAGVNRTVTNESQLTVGENAVIADKSENGAEMTRLSASDAPDKWSVTMWFSNSTQDSFYRNNTDAYGNNITEWQSFITWFKYNAMMGTVPFYFASLSDPDGKKKSVYKFVSQGLPKGTPQGDKIKCQMTWVEVFTEAITVPEQPVISDCIFLQNGQIDFRFAEPPDAETAGNIGLESFTATVQYGETYAEIGTATPLILKDYDFDGFRSVLLYFDELKNDGFYRITVNFTDEGSGIESSAFGLLYVEGEY